MRKKKIAMLMLLLLIVSMVSMSVWKAYESAIPYPNATLNFEAFIGEEDGKRLDLKVYGYRNEEDETIGSYLVFSDGTTLTIEGWTLDTEAENRGLPRFGIYGKIYFENPSYTIDNPCRKMCLVIDRDGYIVFCDTHTDLPIEKCFRERQKTDILYGTFCKEE